MSCKAVSTILFVASIAGVASAEVVSGFYFNSIAVSGSIPTPHASQSGIGSFTTNFAVPGDGVTFTGTTLGGLPEDANGRAAAFRMGSNASSHGRYAQFAFDATGYAEMTLTFATRNSSNGGASLRWISRYPPTARNL